MEKKAKEEPYETDSMREADYLDHPQLREAFSALEARYKRYFDASRDMRFVVAQDGRLMDVNQAGVEMFGYSGKEEMLELPSMGYLYWDQEDRSLLLQKIEENGFIKDYLVEMKCKDGSRFLASITANLWSEEDGAISYEGILRDVSEYRKWQAALIESEKENRQLKQSVEYNRELNKHILQMLMLMSHDIRGPLVAIAATLKLLIRGVYGSMDQSVANTLKDLLSRVAQLLGFAEDCLGKAHTFEGSFKGGCEVFDLRQDIIDPVLDELSNEIQTMGIRIDNRLGAIPAGRILVHVNKIWVKAVFRNLFRNAIKYGGPGCTIAFGFEDHGIFYRLNVYNSGKPIPEEHRPRLFTKFGRIGADGKNSPDGLGLGLYLIKEIIRKHGGDIWYESRPDGSDFVFTLAKEAIKTSPSDR